MKIYNTTDLENKYIKEQATEAFDKLYISPEAYKNIIERHPCHLYMPNYFITIGSGILTTVATIFSALLLWLIFDNSSPVGFFALFAFLAVACYSTLEFLVKNRNYYKAGVDNVLMLVTLTFIVSMVFIEEFDNQYLFATFISMIVSLLLCIRFTDACMAMISYFSSFIFIFLLYIKLGVVAKATAPFLMMMVSAAIYFIANKLFKNKKHLYYSLSLKTIKVLTMVTFYICGNYFVVKELSNDMFNLNLGLHDTIPIGWMFWIFTVIIPPLYIFYGIRKKDLLFIRTGLLLVAVTIFTVRFYYAIFDTEFVMMIAGGALVILSYTLIKYLKTPQRGFTFKQTVKENKTVLNAEALIIAQTLGTKQTAETGTQFGGGSSGGGGASGDF